MKRGVKWLLDSSIGLLKVAVVFLGALFIPRVFIYYMSHAEPLEVAIAQQKTGVFKLGLENIPLPLIRQLAQCRVGIITNHTGKDQGGNRNIDILQSKGLAIATIFTPKHGYHVDKAENQKHEAGVDNNTHIPIVSWTDIKRRKAAMSNIDVLIFDIQDTGMRHGYVTTLLDVMKVAGKQRKKVIVLDRPNLLGSYMEGSLIEGGATVIDTLPVPVRHGMTIGEIAHYCNKHVLSKEIDLQIIPMENYTRHAHTPSSMQYHISPNITTANSCYGYSFLGLLGEIAPFDIGIGTDKPFQCIMLPEFLGVTRQEWYELRTMLKKHGVDGSFYRCFNERKQQMYNGLKIYIKDINNVASFNALLAVLHFFKNAGIQLSFSQRFDAAIGTKKVRDFFDGTLDRQALEESVNKELTAFFTKAISSFIYKPLPQIVRV